MSRKENKAKKARLLTIEDFRKAMDDNTMSRFISMLNNNLYSYRIKQSLYEDGKISPKGFMFNDNIFNLPLGKKNGKGEILISDKLLAIFDRYLMAEQFAEKGDALTAFLVDHNDELYQVLKTNTDNQVKMSDSDYAQIFSKVYTLTSEILLDKMIEAFVYNDDKLIEASEKPAKKEINKKQ